MKTPIQEAIEKVQSLRQIDAVINPIGVIESILSSMLEKEKEVMSLVHKNGYDNSQYKHDCRYGGVEYWDSVPKPFEEYYNEAFNTKER
jgi:hypothetical protein